MAEWKITELSKIGRAVTGTTPSSKFPEDFGPELPFVTPSDFGGFNKWARHTERSLSKVGAERLKNRLLPENSVLVTCIGSDMGKVVMNPMPVVTNQQINAIIPDKAKVDAHFLYYRLRSIYGLLRSFGEAGTAVPILNKGDFERIEVEVPSSVEEQRAIASVLSSLDDKIDLLHRQNRTLEQLAQTLFRQWFVEEAEAEWEASTLGDVVTVKGGTTPSTTVASYWDGGIHWTSPRDLSNVPTLFMRTTAKTITKEGLAQIGSGLLPLGTILLSSRAPIGYVAITSIPVAINQGYIAIICDKAVSNYFMSLWLKANMDSIIGAANGSVFLEISKSVFKTLDFLLPPTERLRKFDSLVSPLFEKINSNEQQIQTLTGLRDTLLPKLMSGEVRVK